MKGIILAGGSGSRLYPSTYAVSKQLMPLYDKPMIFYPLSTLMKSGIRDIVLITTPEDCNSFKKLLGNGSRFGVTLEYVTQHKPNGIAEAFLLTKEVIGQDCVCLILGDNLFFGSQADTIFKTIVDQDHLLGSCGIATRVRDPERYGVVEINNSKKVISIEEKPTSPKSDLALTGIYFYDSSVFQYAEKISPSSRGELEITDLNNLYLAENKYQIEELGSGDTWLDTGTHEALLEAANFIKAIQSRQGNLISSPEEIALKNGWITKDELVEYIKCYSKGPYYSYLKEL